MGNGPITMTTPLKVSRMGIAIMIKIVIVLCLCLFLEGEVSPHQEDRSHLVAHKLSSAPNSTYDVASVPAEDIDHDPERTMSSRRRMPTPLSVCLVVQVLQVRQ